MEVERLRQIADERNGEYSDYTLMPFGQYKGKRLADIESDYFKWWLSQNPDREKLTEEWRDGNFQAKAIASMKIRLYDYIVDRFRNEQDSHQG